MSECNGNQIISFEGTEFELDFDIVRTHPLRGESPKSLRDPFIRDPGCKLGNNQIESSSESRYRPGRRKQRSSL